MEENKPIHNQEEKSAPSTDDKPQQNDQLNTPSIDETVESAAEISTVAEQPKTTNSKPETETMEVHHHAHDPAAPHHKKNWKSYFWEFLMLFLAVFCGFLAEYQLEHKIEKDRAKQYIISFYEDLKTDTAEYARLIAIDKAKLAVLAKVPDCYQSVIKNHGPAGCMEEIISNTLSFINLVNTERTLQQLKNAGGMRMLKKEDADNIYAYDNKIRRYLGYELTLLQERQTNLRNNYVELLRYPDMTAIRLSSDSTLDIRTKELFISANEKEFNKLFNQLTEYTQGIKSRLNFLENLNATANQMLRYFNSKYKLD